MKCKCGVVLFARDIVDTKMVGKQDFHFPEIIIEKILTNTYRCPKCFKVKIKKLK